MFTLVKRLLGALLALAGLALTVVGAWFAVQLGSSGTAEFNARPGTTDPVLVRPAVLNRVDADVVVRATPADGATVWMALANPSDAAAVVGDARHVEVTGVDVREWTLLTRTTGSGRRPSSAPPTCGASRTTTRGRSPSRCSRTRRPRRWSSPPTVARSSR